MLRLRHCFLSHRLEYASWFSQDLDKRLQEKIINCKPQFQAESARIGDKCIFQIVLDNRNVAIGMAEIVLDKRPCTHEHIVILSPEQYLQFVNDIKLLWDHVFINYAKFIEKDYQVGDLVPYLAVSLEPSNDPPLLNETTRLLLKSDLKIFLGALLNTTTDSPDNILWEIDTFEKASESVANVLSVIPPELCPYVSFFLGLYPEQNVKNFNFRVRLRPGENSPIISGNSNLKKGSIAEKLIENVLINDSKNVLRYHQEFNIIYTSLSIFYSGRELNTKALEMASFNDVLTLCRKEQDALMTGNDLDVVLNFNSKFSQLDPAQKEEEVYNTFLKKAREIYRDPKADLSIAARIISQMKKKWLGLEMANLEKEIVFLAYARSGNVKSALGIFSFNQALPHIEDLLKNAQLKTDHLYPFFSACENDFEDKIVQKEQPELFEAFEVYFLQKITSDLNFADIKKNPGIVESWIQWLIKNSQNIKNVEGITNLAAKFKSVLEFDAKKEMDYLVKNDTVPSIFTIILDFLVAIKPTPINLKDYQALTGEYLERLASGMAKESIMPLFSKNTRFDYHFDTQQLYQIFFKKLAPGLNKIGWPDITFGEKKYQQVSERIFNISKDLKQKHGNNEIKKTPKELGQWFEGQKSEPSMNSAQKAKAKDLIKSPVDREHIFSDDHAFWEYLRLHPNFLNEDYSAEMHFDNNPLVLIFDRMEVDPGQEMLRLTEGVDKGKSLFAILPNSLKYFSGKTREPEYTTLIRKFIIKVIEGLLLDPGSIKQTEFKPVYRFDLAKINDAYHNYLDKNIIELISKVNAPDESFDEAYDELRIISGDIAAFRRIKNHPVQCQDREFYIYRSNDLADKQVIMASEILNSIKLEINAEAVLSPEIVLSIARIVLLKIKPGSKWEIKVESHVKNNSPVFIISGSDGETEIKLIMSQDGKHLIEI
jgi:hypothetical protein